MVFYFGFPSKLLWMDEIILAIMQCRFPMVTQESLVLKFSRKSAHAPAFRARATWPVTLAIEPSTKKINYSTDEVNQIIYNSQQG